MWIKYPTYWSSTLTEPRPHTWLVCGVGEMNWESRQWAKPLWGRGGGTQLFLKAFFAGFFFSTYKIILGIHTYIFHNREWFFLNIFFGGDNPRMGGDMSPPSPPGFTPMLFWPWPWTSVSEQERLWRCGPEGARLPVTRAVHKQSVMLESSPLVFVILFSCIIEKFMKTFTALCFSCIYMNQKSRT